MMRKTVLLRCLLGAPIGLAINTMIAIVTSLIVNDGFYYAVPPELVSDFGTEIHTVLIQAIFSLVYGAAFGGASVVWDTDWSIIKMTVVHLIICSTATFPIAYLMRWMEHSAAGVLTYCGIFIAVYAILWGSQYAGLKRKIQALNKKVNENRLSINNEYFGL